MMSKLQRSRMDDVASFIARFREKEGISPTIREIQFHMGVRSSSTAYEVVRNLKRSGRIETKGNCPRTITVTGRKETKGAEGNH